MDDDLTALDQQPSVEPLSSASYIQTTVGKKIFKKQDKLAQAFFYKDWFISSGNVHIININYAISQSHLWSLSNRCTTDFAVLMMMTVHFSFVRIVDESIT